MENVYYEKLVHGFKKQVWVKMNSNISFHFSMNVLKFSNKDKSSKSWYKNRKAQYQAGYILVNDMIINLNIVTSIPKIFLPFDSSIAYRSHRKLPF